MSSSTGSSSLLRPASQPQRNKSQVAQTNLSRAFAAIVGRLTRSRPLTRSNELPVDVARVPAAPFCEKPASDTDALQKWVTHSEHTVRSSFDIRISSFYRPESSQLAQRQRMFVKSLNDPP